MILFFIGILGGILAGLLGIGGGVIFIAVLPYFLQKVGVAESELAAYTVANSLFGTFFSALSSVVSQHFSLKNLPYGQAIKMGLSAAVLASLCFWLIVSQPWYSKEVFSTVVIVLLSALLFRSILSLFRKEPVSTQCPAERPAFLTLIGAFSGMVSSLSGLGGGVIVVPALRFIGKYPVQYANFISSFTIATASLAAIISSIFRNQDQGMLGYLVPAVSVPLALGVLIGAPIGVRLVPRLLPRTITILFCVFVGAVLLKYLYTLIAG